MAINTFICQFQHLHILCRQIHQPARIGGWGGGWKKCWPCQDFESFCSPNTDPKMEKRKMTKDFAPATCSDALTQTCSQHNEALSKSSQHTLHEITSYQIDNYLCAIPSPNRTTLKLCPAILPWCYVHFNFLSSWPAFLRFLCLNWNPAHSGVYCWCQCHPWQLLPNDPPPYLCG